MSSLARPRSFPSPRMLPILLAGTLHGAAAFAQPAGARPASERTYGTMDRSVSTIGAWEFVPISSAITWGIDSGEGDRYLTSVGVLLASVHLPAGASVSSIEIQGCDDDNPGFLAASLYSNTVSGGLTETATLHGGVNSPPSGTPGCDFFFGSLPSPVTIDNFRRTYFVQVQTNVATSAVRFSAVRLYYTLQISPAPLVATFADVPTDHLYFRAIEALADAGITTGCGGGNFCPAQNVTRGEMAAFLARALGLQWAP